MKNFNLNWTNITWLNAIVLVFGALAWSYGFHMAAAITLGVGSIYSFIACVRDKSVSGIMTNAILFAMCAFKVFRG